ncbi:MAG: tRNA (N6-isopentenyl adenosine(37)-C2)-methylthiotransferase MiaB, partial [Oscillospiraceae bacterium]
MNRTTTHISPEDIGAQRALCAQIAARFSQEGVKPLARVETYGCQQNEADSQRLMGYLAAMGYGFTDSRDRADLVLLNTCAVREHAEDRVLGNVGALVHTKKNHPGQVVCLCGCMMQEPQVAAKIKESYRHVDLVFGPHALWRFPALLQEVLARRARVFDCCDEEGSIAEGIPVTRTDPYKAWVSVMYGCNNFCSYCIVPYV